MYGNDLLRYSKQPYIVFDTETESLNLCKVRAWDLAWAICEGDRIIERHQYFINWPKLNVSRGAARITKFDPQKIAELGVEPRVAFEHFFSYLYDPKYYSVVHNGLNYDVYVLKNCARELGMAIDFSYINRLYDSNAIGRAIEMKIPYYKEKYSILEYQYRFANSPRQGIKTNLTALGKKYKLDFKESDLHGAAKDVNLNFDVWRKQVWEIEI